MTKNDGSEIAELTELNVGQIRRLTAQTHDLGRQARVGFQTVENLVDILDEILEDKVAMFETTDTRPRAIVALERAQYFLKTGHSFDGVDNEKEMNDGQENPE